jgi:N-acetylmuramoyl-L-alanine amidase
MFKILEDPGHDTQNDNVGYSKQYSEATGMLKVAKCFKEEMSKYKDVQCDLTRDKDKYISLTTRGMMAKGYDLFCSDHTNAASNPDIDGVEGFYSVDHPEDKEIVELLCNAISSYFNIHNRGAKVRPGTNDPTEDFYTVIDKAEDSGCKHVILMEYMFHSNPEGEKTLLDDDNLKMIAKLKADVLAYYYGLVLKEDVSEWAKEPQKWAMQFGISDGTRPKDNVTREEIWTMMYNYFNNVQ